jgi:energy-coupling factor transport system substrate-specific component
MATTTRAEVAGGWRTLDIVVAAVVAIAFGVVFQGWNILWETTTFVMPPLRGAIYGVWMLPAVIVPLIVRRPGAALFGETVAAAVSMALGAQWGLLVIVYGLIQGAGAELIFAFGGYRRWTVVFAVVAGAAAGLGGALLDLAFFYPEWGFDWQLLYGVLVVLSSAIIAGIGGWLLVQALLRTGVLSDFPAGREQERV